MSITLAIPTDLVQEVRAYAARNETSLNQLIRDYLVELVGIHGEADRRAEEFEHFAKMRGATQKRPYKFRRADAYEEELG